MKHIGIIGAGLSGLATAKAFLQQGYHVTIIEKARAIGGVWELSRSYLGVATQTTRDEYAFSDFPMPSTYPMWPTGAQVQQYLEDYAQHFGVTPHIRFRTTVTNLEYANGQWQMDTYDAANDLPESLRFDYVAVCTGTFHKPFIPAWKGMASFPGAIMHTSQVNDPALLEQQSVAVVGFAKSATDIATLAAGLGRECHLLYRKAQWKVPRFFGSLINMRYLLFSRFSEAFFNSPYKTGFQKFLHTAGRPMVWAQWRGLELLLKSQFKLKACGMVPKHRIEDQISCSLGVAPDGFYDKVRSGLIKAKQTEIDRIEGRQVYLTNGEVIQPDLIICGTGFSQSLPFLESKYREVLIGADGGYRLFRNIIHPQIPQLGFIGFNSSLFSTLTSEIAANWFVKYVEGSLHLPATTDIQKDVQYMADWRRTERPVSAEFSGTCVAPFNFMHLDQLMRDMGLPATATRWWPYEFFKPINPKDYRILLARATKKAPVAPTPVYRTAEIIQ
jgi:cation diffusion facilitator CzcD-associated flavoprotein CzcO